MTKTNNNELVNKISNSNFLVRIHFKQNTNWQGIVHWLEHNKTVPFRSALELLFLLNEAVEQTNCSNDNPELRSWDNSNVNKDL